MKRAALLSLLALTIGCSVPVDRHDVAASLPIPSDFGVAAPDDDPGIVAWSESFDAPALDRLIAEALENNRSLEAAAARLRAAAAQARIAGADRYPSVSGSFDAARRRQNFVGFPIPGSDRGVITSETGQYGLGLNVSWEADLWGRVAHGAAAAAADREAARVDVEGARLSLAAQVTKGWFTAVEAAAQADLAEATLANRRATAERIERRYLAGLAPAVELRLARATAAATEAVVAQRVAIRDVAVRQLEILLGRYPSAEVERGTALPAVAQPIPAGLPAALLARRPDLRALELRLRAAERRVGQARASLYPQIRLTASGGTSTDELGSLVDGDFTVWSFLFNLVQPVFQGGRLRAGVDLREAIADELAATFAQRALTAFAEVESGLFADALLARQVEALDDAARHARAARESAEERYAAGLADYLFVLEAQRQAYDAESRLLAARRERLVNRADLYLALGGAAPPDSVERAGMTSE